MHILICGGRGFLGRTLCEALEAAGHHVTCTSRRGGGDDWALDFTQMSRPEDWATWIPRLRAMDAVINAVGIIRETRTGDFERIHHRAPAALFAACAEAGVKQVIQLSALGTLPADKTVPYLASKRAGDAALLALSEQLPGGVVVRPGLVFGAGGRSTRFFLALSSLPVLFRPRSAGSVQVIHEQDLAELITRLLDWPISQLPRPAIVDAPGPQALAYGDWLATYRQGLGLAQAPSLTIPDGLIEAATHIAKLSPRTLLTPDTWALLKAGNTGDPALTERILGRPLRRPRTFFPLTADASSALAQRALADWRTPLLRGVLALLWLVTALVSAGLFPEKDSLALLAPFGLSGPWQALGQVVLYGASLLDAALGLATLFLPGRRLWWAQLGLIGVYTLLIAWQLPAFLIHPFGPVLKNLAVAALLIQLLAEEQRP